MSKEDCYEKNSPRKTETIFGILRSRGSQKGINENSRFTSEQEINKNIILTVFEAKNGSLKVSSEPTKNILSTLLLRTSKQVV